jgi:hypothetical protein
VYKPSVEFVALVSLDIGGDLDEIADNPSWVIVQ